MRSFRFLLGRFARLAPALLLRLAIGLQFTAWVGYGKVCLLCRWPHNTHLAWLILLLWLCVLGEDFWFLILLSD